MNLTKYLIIVGFTLPLLTGCNSLPFLQAATPENAIEETRSQDFNFTYDEYADVLKTYVDEDGFVDYKGLQLNRQKLDRFNQSLALVSQEMYDSWNEKEQIAFWTNAYNSFTLQSIIDQEPLKSSIKDILGVWKGRRFQIAEQSKTLDDIEHKTLRPNYNEPRIHAVINCASISCPILRTEPYTGEKLEEQLEEQTQNWISSPHGMQIDREKNIVSLSSLFDWFGSDWEKDYSVEEGKFTGNNKQRATLNFISNYVSDRDRQYLEAGEYEIRYLDYNWNLNIQK
ncbi:MULTISPECIES: DUF547 domain-containing protein [Spirulina sp. CCY15215]|uniref:DUF547 domain-containing protein n=1 Tax=Spirulina sp. CCY15215 TaxID=2767591 RepID=UPI0019527B54|nr:DUF547 domain-containing protein [Spirulina major]